MTDTPPRPQPMSWRLNRPFVQATLAAFLLSFAVYALVIRFDAVTDIDAHINVVHGVMAGTAEMPPNFLYYGTVALFGGFSENLAVLTWAAVFILALSTAAKVFLTMLILRAATHDVAPGLIAWMALALMVVFPLPALSNLLGLNFYLGQLPANVWHNSTTIFLMPVALLLFYLNYRYAFQNERQLFGWVLGLGLVSLFIKPSYFIALLPATGLHLAWTHGVGRESIRRLLPLGLGIAALGLLYLLVFEKQVGLIQEEPSYLTLDPFMAWETVLSSDLRVEATPLVMVAMMITALLTSFALPLGMWIAGAWPRGDGMVTNATIGVCTAMAIYLVLAETGPRAIHGNFFWQVVVCHYILLTVLAASVVQKINDRKVGRGLRMLLYLGAAMVLMGLLYLPRVALQNYS